MTSTGDDDDENEMIKMQTIGENDQRMTYDMFLKSLHELSQNIAERERIHRQEEQKNEKWRKGVSYPAMVFSSVTFVSSITWLSKHSQKPECSPDLWLQVLTTIVTLLTLIFVTTRDFFKLDERKSVNATAAERLRSLFYTTEDYMRITQGKEGDRYKIVQSLRKQYRNVVRVNPPITTNLTTIVLNEETSKTIAQEKCEAPIDIEISARMNENHDRKLPLEMQYRLDRLETV